MTSTIDPATETATRAPSRTGHTVVDTDIHPHALARDIAPRLSAEHRRRWTDAKVDRARYSMSLFVWYFGTDRTYDDVAHHTILLGPRYEGLLDDIFRKQRLAEDFSLYLHRPTATDPSLAPAGHDGFYVLSPVPHLDSGDDWEALREPYRRKIEAFLASTILPDLDFAPAVVVLTRVVSRPAQNRLCLDLGHKAVASENGQAPGR